MINKALKIIRQFHNLKQSELAGKIQISKSYLSELESGKKPVSLDILEKYSKHFEIPVSSLVFFSENMSKNKTIPEKFRTVFAGKILNIMEWFTSNDESEKIKA